MSTTPRQQRMRLLSIAFAVAPIAFSLIRAARGHHDLRMFWMALVALIGTTAVMIAGHARRRSTRELILLASVALIVAMLLAGWTAMHLGATAAAGIWPVAFVLSICWVMTFVFDALSRRA